MPLRLFPFALALILGAVYLLGGFEQTSDNFVGVHESQAAIEDAVIYSLSDDRLYAIEDFIIDLSDPFHSAIDVPFR